MSEEEFINARLEAGLTSFGTKRIAPLQKIIPTLATLDAIALEQIRAVVREEIQAAMKPPIWNAEAMTSEELTKRLKDWKPRIEVSDNSIVEPPKYYIPGNPIAGTRQLNLEAFQMKAFGLPAVKYVEFDPEYDEAIDGHSSITAELEHQGKLYKGILYYQKDVE